MGADITPGLSAEVFHKVERNFLASEVGSGLVNVFSTAMMIAFMEEAAVAAVQPLLAPGLTTVGVRVDVSHKAASPLGMGLKFTAVLKEVLNGGKKLLFEVAAYDERDLIGQGLHERVLVTREKFEARALNKLNSQ